jgi:DNA polymerase-3 subunit delta'
MISSIVVRSLKTGITTDSSGSAGTSRARRVSDDTVAVSAAAGDEGDVIGQRSPYHIDSPSGNYARDTIRLHSVMPFQQVLGHRRLVALLARTIDRGTLPPSLMFTGPEGVGKRLTAIATAQLLNCKNRRDTQKSPFGELGELGGDPPRSPDIDACGVCTSCTRIAKGKHSDVLIVEPGETGSIKIEQVRAVIDAAGYRPFQGQCRVVIIDSAEALVPQAQHALLKSLEEPPSASVFILVTAQPDLLLATVRSRCPQLRFGPLAVDDIATVLVQHGKTPQDARAIAAAADGSLGRALASMAGDLAERRDVAQQVLARSAATADPRRRLDAAKDLLVNTGAGGAADRDRLAIHLRAMASLLRDAAVLSTGSAVSALANPDMIPALERLAQTYRGARVDRAFLAVDQALAALDRNAGVKIVADWLVLQL